MSASCPQPSLYFHGYLRLKGGVEVSRVLMLGVAENKIKSPLPSQVENVLVDGDDPMGKEPGFSFGYLLRFHRKIVPQ